MFTPVAVMVMIFASAGAGVQPDPRAEVPPRVEVPTSPAGNAPAPSPASGDPAATPAGSGEKSGGEAAGSVGAALEVAIAYPHPIITEVLFAVPGGDAGDANGDGKRHVSGDEFVELYNPHDKAIQLRGYKLTDANAPDKGQLRFVFPLFELPPGGAVVVFNGFGCSWFGPVGDAKAAPMAANDRFGNAWVFTMKAASQYVAFSNTGDHVLLTGPDGSPVHRVSWGEPKDQGAFDRVEPLLDDRAMQTGKSSVQRDSLSRVASFRGHTDLPFDMGGDKLFSPGVWKALPQPRAKKQLEEGEKGQREELEVQEEGGKK